MAYQLLIEGALDTKGPRGSENRKFWKAWRRQWAKFSVVYPSGRREPYLVLTLSHNSSESSDKEIKFSRDGLRLFRCRSKSRPYRTWAITSGNKVALYFASDSEIQAQHWMQSVRDGLWPTCFSFQMLTACSYEVSLIDDDNTFMAGHLGVYGRFVLTSEDVISLMHPHWGSTLLEISLDNIIDVLFIREAEISPAGVFSIILKRVEGSNVTALQFFCNTAKDAIQWILSKLYTRRQSFSLNPSRKLSENRVSFSISDDSVSSKDNIYKTSSNENTIISIDNQISPSQADNELKNISEPLIDINLQPEYENLQYLQMNRFQSIEKHSTFDKGIDECEIDHLENTCEEIMEKSRSHSSHAFSLHPKNVDENDLLGIISNENTYENVTNKRFTAGKEYFETLSATDNLNSLRTECVNQKGLNMKSHSVIDNELPLKSSGDKFPEYAIISKSNIQESEDLLSKEMPTIDRNVYANCVLKSDNFDKSEVFSVLENSENKKVKSTSSSKTSCSIFPDVKKIESNGTEVFKNIPEINYDLKFTESTNSNDYLYSIVDKTTSTNSQSMQQSINNSFNYHGNITNGNYNTFLNLPSSFLDTSLNSLNPRIKGRGSSSSSEEDNEILLSLVNEFDVLKTNDQIYEDLLERKGTIYEEIDEHDGEFNNPSSIAPELPKRPTNLEIPESLRLQKLSRNIHNTLEVMEDKGSQKEILHPKFIKKVKDVNRIMRLTPDRENSKEPFKVESKLKLKPTIGPILPPSALKRGA